MSLLIVDYCIVYCGVNRETMMETVRKEVTRKTRSVSELKKRKETVPGIRSQKMNNERPLEDISRSNRAQ